jgi:LAO/AO transport system kinase
VLDSAGFNIILVETVGAGQSEVEIARIAPSVIVVEAPGRGDDVQAIKAGILEIADVLVVNKADQPGAPETARTLQAMLQLGHPLARERMVGLEPDPNRPLWIPPVIQTVALEGTGISEVVAALEQHRQYLTDHGVLERLAYQQIEMELMHIVQSALLKQLKQGMTEEVLAAIISRVQAREMSPQRAVQEILELSMLHDHD